MIRTLILICFFALIVFPVNIHDPFPKGPFGPPIPNTHMEYLYLSEMEEIDCAEVGHHDLLCLACNNYHEARGEPVRGQKKVAEVVLNRANSDRYPLSICDVVWQPNQFTWTLRDNQRMKGEELQKSLDIAFEYWLKHKNDIEYTDNPNVLHYHAKSVLPKWASNLKQSKVIGQHIFYETRVN